MGTDKRARQKANRQKAREARVRKQKLNKVRRRGMIFGIGIPVLVIALFGVAQIGGGDTNTSDTTAATASTAPTASTTPGETIKGKTPCPKTDGSERRVTTFEQAPPMCIDTKKSYTATFNTSEGEVVVELDVKRTPKTVNNFVVLSNYKYYDGTPIFRTDPSIDIIQGGGPDNTSGPGYTIEDEGGKFTYKEGDLVMARSSGPNSGGAQFFFATGPKVSLLDDQGTYVTFGKVTKGLDVVKAIIALHQADDSGLGGTPSREVLINSISIK